MKQGEIKSKYKALSVPGVSWVLIDMLEMYDTEICGRQSKPIEEYALIAKKMIKAMKGWYKEQLQTDEVTVKTRDIEALIADLASGKEKPWKNKLIDNGE